MNDFAPQYRKLVIPHRDDISWVSCGVSVDQDRPGTFMIFVMCSPRAIEELLRINQQQKLLIQVLCDAYNSPTDRGRLFMLLQNQFSIDAQAPSPSQKAAAVHQRAKQDSCESEAKWRVKELEREIFEQDEEYRLLEQRLLEYNRVAQHYEAELAKVGEGNVRLLASFQQNANQSAEFKELEAQAGALNAEFEQVKRQNSDRKQLYAEIQDQVTRSNGEYLALQQQVAKAKKRLDSPLKEDPQLQRRIAEQERQILQLNQEIDEAKETTAQLKRENQMLRDRLENPDSDSS
jgi:chromosome segregation ATPase